MTLDDRLRAPDHVVRHLAALVDELAGLDRPRPDRAPLHPAERNERVRARAREVADRLWVEAFVAGGAYMQAIGAVPMTLVVKSGSAMIGKRIDVEQPPAGAE